VFEILLKYRENGNDWKFEILLKYRENGNDWKKAMLDVLPNRKDVKAKDDGVEKGRGNSETHAPDSEVIYLRMKRLTRRRKCIQPSQLALFVTSLV
jgi:hypothetical protein